MIQDESESGYPEWRSTNPGRIIHPIEIYANSTFQLGSAALVKVIGDPMLRVSISIRYLDNREISDAGKNPHF